MPRTYDNKKKESALLGMPWTTATTRLQRMLMFALAVECGKGNCHRCSEPIESVKDFSIEHIISWLDEPEKYWDLSNIAFSHTDCNRRAGRKRGGGTNPEMIAVWKTRFSQLDSRGGPIPPR